MLGFPEGTGELLNPTTKRKLVISLFGSLLISVLDTLGVLAMLPLMQLVTGTDVRSGALGVIADALGTRDTRTLVITISGVIVGAFAVKGLVTVAVRRWQLRFMADQEAETSTSLLRGFLQGPYAWHLNRNTSDMIWTIETSVTLGYASGMTSGLGAVTELLSIVLIVGALVVVAPIPTVCALVYFGAAGLLLLRVLRPRTEAASQRLVDASHITARTSLQALGAVKEVKLRRSEEVFVERYGAARTTGARARATSMLLTEVPKYLLEVVFVLGVAMLAGIVTSLDGPERGLAILGLFVAAGSRILPSTVRLVASISGIRFGREPLAELVVEWRRQRAEALDQQERVRTDEVPTGDITIEDLRFAYSDDPDSEVLRGVDATITSGRSIALVGSSGAGKSTLIDVLLGLHHPTGGSLRAGGVEVFDNLPAWQAQLAVVPQEVYLLDESLRNNITFNEPEDPELLEDVLRRSQLTDLVASLPEGLDTEVGERGVRLSGGQRQRIGIARALYRNPTVLVLDEATSALDNETERRLTETIESLKGTMTMLIVAHRLSTVRHCDELLFMSQGRVASRGTFDEVAQSNAEFARLVALGTLDPQDGELAPDPAPAP